MTVIGPLSAGSKKPMAFLCLVQSLFILMRRDSNLGLGERQEKKEGCQGCIDSSRRERCHKGAIGGERKVRVEQTKANVY